MPIFTIPVRWSVYAEIEIDAINLAQAIEAARSAELPSNDCVELIEDSFEVDDAALDLMYRRT